MTVYIAAPFVHREIAKAAREYLAGHGIGCTSRWLDSHAPGDDMSNSVLMMNEALEDLYDINKADALVLLNYPELARAGGGGKHVEFGYAVAMKIPVYVIGKRTTVFHFLPNITVVPSLDDAIPHLQAQAITYSTQDFGDACDCCTPVEN